MSGPPVKALSQEIVSCRSQQKAPPPPGQLGLESPFDVQPLSTTNNQEQVARLSTIIDSGLQQADGLPAAGTMGRFSESHEKSPGNENGNSEPATPPSFFRQLRLGVQVGLVVGTIAYHGIRLFHLWAQRRGRPRYYGEVVPPNMLQGGPVDPHLPFPGEIRDDDLVLPQHPDDPMQAIPYGDGVRRRVRVVEMKAVEHLGVIPVVQDNPLDNNSDTGPYQVYNFDTRCYHVPDLTALGLQPTFREMFAGVGEEHLTWRRIILKRGDVTVELPVDTVNRLKIFWLKVGLCDENARLIFSVAAEAVRKLALSEEQAAYVIIYSSVVATLAAAQPMAEGGVSSARLAALGRFLGPDSINCSIYESGRALGIPIVHWSMTVLAGVTAAITFTAVTYVLAQKEYGRKLLLEEVRSLRRTISPKWQ